METLTIFLKRLKIFVEKSLNLWSNSHLTICWYEKPLEIVKIAHKIMLENLIPLNVYLKINLKGEILIWGKKRYSIFKIHYFWSILKIMCHWICRCTMYFFIIGIKIIRWCIIISRNLRFWIHMQSKQTCPLMMNSNIQIFV